MRECRAEGCPHIAADGCDYCKQHDEPPQSQPAQSAAPVCPECGCERSDWDAHDERAGTDYPDCPNCRTGQAPRYVQAQPSRSDAREVLRLMQNGWLRQRQVNRARCLAAVGSEQACEDYLAYLRRDIQQSIALWRLSQ